MEKDYGGWEGVLPPEQIQRMKELDAKEEHLNREGETIDALMVSRLEHLDAFLDQAQDVVLEYFQEQKREKPELTAEDFYRDLKRNLVKYFSFFKEEDASDLPKERYLEVDAVVAKYPKLVRFWLPFHDQTENISK